MSSNVLCLLALVSTPLLLIYQVNAVAGELVNYTNQRQAANEILAEMDSKNLGYQSMSIDELRRRASQLDQPESIDVSVDQPRLLARNLAKLARDLEWNIFARRFSSHNPKLLANLRAKLQPEDNLYSPRIDYSKD